MNENTSISHCTDVQVSFRTPTDTDTYFAVDTWKYKQTLIDCLALLLKSNQATIGIEIKIEGILWKLTNLIFSKTNENELIPLYILKTEQYL